MKMSLPEDARKRAADLADSVQATTDPVQRDVLANLRNLWIAIADQSSMDDEMARKELDKSIQLHATRASASGRLH
jgi:hypothetical protein